MKPGRELDALIAERVFGDVVIDLLTRKEYPITSALAIGMLSDAQINRIPPFSTDIAAAWLVVEKIKNSKKGAHFTIIYRDWESPPDWMVGYDLYEDWIYEATATTAPHAICLIALASIQPDHNDSQG